MAEEEKKEGEEGAEGAPKKSKKKLIIIIVLVLVLAIGGGVGFMMMGKKEVTAEDAEAALHQEDHSTETIDLGTYVVNLSENATFLKVSVVLEVNSHVLHGGKHGAAADAGGGHGGGGGGLPGVLGEKEAKIKDKIIKILSSKKAPQLLDPEGKDELKEEVADGINQVVELDEELVTNVFFVTFIIQ